TVPINKIPDDAMALDVGPRTLEQFQRLLSPARTIFWNGPMGVFEKPPFDAGTMALAKWLAAASAVTVVGGGESVQAVHAAGGAGVRGRARRTHRPRGSARPRARAGPLVHLVGCGPGSAGALVDRLPERGVRIRGRLHRRGLGAHGRRGRLPVRHRRALGAAP